MKKTTIAIQGGYGSYHEQAVMDMFGDTVRIIPRPTFAAVFEGLQKGEFDRAVVAIANNAFSFIPETSKYLMRDKGESVRISGEMYVRVDLQLVGLPGVHIDEITEIHSQIPAISECSYFLANALPDATIIEENDTALSAEIVAAHKKRHIAAIASARAGEIHGLSQIASGIQDEQDNITRFLLLDRASNIAPPIEGSNKTTCILNTGQTPGALHAALTPFKDAGVSISSLQSRFIPNSPFHMEFLLEFDAGVEDERVSRIFNELHALDCDIQILGSYIGANVPISDK